jgi:hypothetical protein
MKKNTLERINTILQDFEMVTGRSPRKLYLGLEVIASLQEIFTEYSTYGHSPHNLMVMGLPVYKIMNDTKHIGCGF